MTVLLVLSPASQLIWCVENKEHREGHAHQLRHWRVEPTHAVCFLIFYYDNPNRTKSDSRKRFKVLGWSPSFPTAAVATTTTTTTTTTTSHAWKCLPHRPPITSIFGGICHIKLNEMGPDSQYMPRICSTDQSSQTVWLGSKRLDSLLASSLEQSPLVQLIGSYFTILEVCHVVLVLYAS